MFRELITAEQVVDETPHYRGDEEKDEHSVTSLPGPAVDDRQQQRYICYYRN